MEHYIAVCRYEISLLVLKKYRKIPKISPGACIFQRPFLRGLFLEGHIFGGAYLWRESSVSKSIGLVLQLKGNLPFLLCFTLYLRAISKYKPPGGLYLEGRFNGGFFCVASLGGLYLELRGAYFRNFTVFHSFAALMITREIFFNTRREISYLRAAMLYPLFPTNIYCSSLVLAVVLNGSSCSFPVWRKMFKSFSILHRRSSCSNLNCQKAIECD